MKKTLRVLSAAGLLSASAFTLVACGSKVDLSTLVLTEDGTAVSGDFEVPTNFNSKKITWSSSDESVVKFYTKETTSTTTTDQTVTTTYAGVMKPEESKEVTLTAKVGKSKKQFTVKVNAVDVYEIADSFSFTEAGTIVSDCELSLPTSYTYSYSSGASETAQTFTAQMSWTSSNTDLVAIEGEKGIVSHADEKTAVTLSCTFTYGSDTTTYTYKVQVWKELNPTEQLQYWYDNPGNGETFNFYGYVVGVNGYSESYGNGLFYVMNADKTGVYYLYRGKMDKATYDTLTSGQAVYVKGATSTNYNGLIESNAGAVITPLSAAEAQAKGLDASIDVAALEYTPVDNYVETKAKEANYFTSSKVSLSGWKVKEITTKTLTAEDTKTLITVEKNGVTLDVIYSKYGLTTYNSDLTASVLAVVNSLAVGNYVDIKGQLSNYNAWQIQIDAADSITKVNAEGNADTDAEALNAVINGTEIESAYTSDAEVTLPTSSDNVAVSFALKRSNYKSVKIENGKLVITPKEEKETVVLNATFIYTNGDLTLTVTKSYEITTQLLDDAGKAEVEALAAISTDAVSVDTLTELPTKGETYTDVSLAYEVTEGASVAKIVEGKLLVVPTTEATTVKVTVTATLNEATVAKEITFTAQAAALNTYADYVANCAAKATTVMTIKGIVVGYNPARTNVFVQDYTDPTKGYYVYANSRVVDLVEVNVGDVVYLVGTGTTYTATGKTVAENEIVLTKSISYVYNFETAQTVTATPTATDISADLSTEPNYIHSLVKITDATITEISGKNVTVSLNDKTGYISLNNLSDISSLNLAVGCKISTTGYVKVYNDVYWAYAVSLDDVTVTITDAAKLETSLTEAAAKFASTYTTSGTQVEVLATGTTYNTVALSYAFDNAAAALADGKVTFTFAADTTVKVTITATLSTATASKEVTVELKAPEAIDLSQYTVDGSAQITLPSANYQTAGDNDDLTSTLGISVDGLTLTASKNNASNATLAHTQNIRLYAGSGNGGSLTIAADSSKLVITSIVVTYNSATYASPATVTSNAATLTATTAELVYTYTVNGVEVTIQNTASSGQVRIDALVINYKTKA